MTKDDHTIELNQQFNMTKDKMQELFNKDGFAIVINYHEPRNGSPSLSFKKRQSFTSLESSIVTHPTESIKLHIIDGHVIIDYSDWPFHHYDDLLLNNLDTFIKSDKEHFGVSRW